MHAAIIGSGGREHVIAWCLEASPKIDRVTVMPGNGGTPNTAAISPGDTEGILAFCREEAVGLVIIGPEDPLVDGLADRLRAEGFRVFGPGARAALLEGSKAHSKAFMRRHGVATADYGEYDSPAAARADLDRWAGGCVVKYDGLAAGKGVFVCQDRSEAEEALSLARERYGADATLVVEELLRGREISILGFTDGQTIRMLTPSQDHKQLLDGDRGPNTGGMGAFCPVPFCDDGLLAAIDDEVVAPTLAGLRAEDTPCCGVLYFGLMITDEGPKLLEYNVRLGDPEAEVILPALQTDLVDLIEACIDGRLEEQPLEVKPGYLVDVVLASGGYPGPVQKGVPIEGLGDLAPETLVFHAGTRRDGDQVVTSGGRVLNIVCRGDSLEEALDRVYAEVAKVRFEGMQYRRDIGRREGQ